MNDTTRLPAAPDRRSNRGKVESATSERICMGCCKGVCGDGSVPAGGPARAAEGGNVTQAEFVALVLAYKLAVGFTARDKILDEILAALTAAGVPE